MWIILCKLTAQTPQIYKLRIFPKMITSIILCHISPNYVNLPCKKRSIAVTLKGPISHLIIFDSKNKFIWYIVANVFHLAIFDSA